MHPSPDAERHARHYQRRKAGRIVVRCEVDEIYLIEFLAAEGLLTDDQVDRDEMEKALSRFINATIKGD
jgi:hypothetical protein